MRASGESALGALDFAPGPEGIWVDARCEIGAVVCDAGVLLGWVDLDWDGQLTARRRLRDVEHVLHDRLDDLPASAVRARALRRRALARCELCDTGRLPGHVH